MADLVVLRVEVADSGSVNESSLSTNKNTTDSLSAKASPKDKFDKQMKANVKEVAENGMLYTGRGESREDRLRYRQTARWMIRNAEDPSYVRPLANSMYRRNISLPSHKQIATGVSTIATTTTALYSLYSNYQKAGYEMSGATHAAAVQGRKASIGSTVASIGIAAMINPALAAPMIAMKAWQLAQTNRKELFEIQKSQITSQILQRNLVKTVAERRF